MSCYAPQCSICLYQMWHLILVSWSLVPYCPLEQAWGGYHKRMSMAQTDSAAAKFLAPASSCGWSKHWQTPLQPVTSNFTWPANYWTCERHTLFMQLHYHTALQFVNIVMMQLDCVIWSCIRLCVCKGIAKRYSTFVSPSSCTKTASAILK